MVEIGKNENDIIDFMDKHPTERREHERFPFREHIVVDGLMKSTSLDISEGGLYVSVSQPFHENTVIDLTIPVNGEPLRVKATVRYCQMGIGMGVKFIDLNDGQRRKLKQLIVNITTKSA